MQWNFSIVRPSSRRNHVIFSVLYPHSTKLLSKIRCRLYVNRNSQTSRFLWETLITYLWRKKGNLHVVSSLMFGLQDEQGHYTYFVSRASKYTWNVAAVESRSTLKKISFLNFKLSSVSWNFCIVLEQDFMSDFYFSFWNINLHEVAVESFISDR